MNKFAKAMIAFSLIVSASAAMANAKCNHATSTGLLASTNPEIAKAGSKVQTIRAQSSQIGVK